MAFSPSQAAEVMPTELEVDSLLRITSISVASYDYLITLPVEFRMYRPSGTLEFGWSINRVLFILMRYVSIALLTISNVGYFHHGFSVEACSRFYVVPSVLKVIQIMLSQIIVGYRTWNIAQRSRDVGMFLLGFGFMITALEWYSNFDARKPVQSGGNCSPGNFIASVPQWIFYLLATIFDVTAIALSSFFLTKSAGGISRMSSTIKVLFYDGLVYVVVLTASNVMNLILYRNSVERSIQPSGPSFGYMVVWIMSQSILIHVYEAAEARARREFILGPIGRGMAHNVRTNKDLDVQVQIEQAVMVDYDTRTHRKPRVLWERRQNEIAGGDISSGDQGQWELSRVAKTAGTV